MQHLSTLESLEMSSDLIITYKNVTSRKQHEVEINIFLPTVSECDASLRCKVYKCHQTFEEDKNNNKVLQNQPMMTFLFLRIRMWNKSLSSRRISGGKVDLSVDQIQLLGSERFFSDLLCRVIQSHRRKRVKTSSNFYKTQHKYAKWSICFKHSILPAEVREGESLTCQVVNGVRVFETYRFLVLGDISSISTLTHFMPFGCIRYLISKVKHRCQEGLEMDWHSTQTASWGATKACC